MNLKNNQTRSRRLRKKLYLDEFAVSGFECACKIDVEIGAEFDAFIDDFVDFLDSQNLIAGGGGSPADFAMFVMSAKRYQSTSEADREAVKNWLSNHALVSTIVTGELVNAYY